MNGRETLPGLGSASVNIAKASIADTVLAKVPAAAARRLTVLPLAFADGELTVAIAPDADPLAVADQLENLLRVTVETVFADDADALRTAIRRYYPAAGAEAGSNAKAFFHMLVNRALQLRASDIHICPRENGAEVKMRIDGKLRTDRELELAALTELTAVVKILAGLDIAEKRAPLDGSINLALDGEEISMRVATVPTLYGEHLTLRLLTQDHDAELEQIDSLGMSARHREMFRNAINEPNGIVLLSGPTGSGKTTTLYAALRHLCADGSRHVVSIEDPVEKPVPGVTQIKVDADGERLTFGKALRSVLRHDPDVIMIGEIRDFETADIAVKSALTGHLVLSTLHTNSAAGVMTRLVDIGVAPFLVASTLRLAIAQRLVRVPCAQCVRYRRPGADECREFGWDTADEKLRVPEVSGCPLCGGKGYAGRAALYEMIAPDNAMRRLLLRGGDEYDIAQCAFEMLKLPSLHADGAEKILSGVTTVSEVREVTASFALAGLGRG